MVGLIVFVDSNIFIFASIEEYPEFKVANEKLISLATKAKLGINSIILSEVFHKLSVIKDVRSARRKVLDILNSEYTVFIPIEERTVRKAVELAATRKIRINDAIIAQHALDSNAAIFTDNIRDFRKVRKLKVIPLRKT